MKRLLYVLNGKFLTSEDAFKNWRFIIFSSLLTIIMISSSHNTDKKVHRIAILSTEIKMLTSQYVEYRTITQSVKIRSNVIKKTNYKLKYYPDSFKKIIVQVDRNVKE